MERYERAAGLAGLAGLLGYIYYPVIISLAAQWSIDTTFGYGYAIPPVVGYLVWSRRRELQPDPEGGSWWGYAILVAGLSALVLGEAGGIQLLARGSLIVVLFGLSVFLGGWRMTRRLAFPLAFLAIMIPLPPGVFYRLTWPFQVFTAQFSTAALRLAGYPVLLQGIYIDLPTARLEVEAACSGFRSLVALGATAILLAYMTQNRWADRLLLVLSVLPIAVLANAVRVTSNIMMGFYTGAFHILAGWVVFVLATACLLLVNILLTHRKTFSTAP